jgi:hypothetical protein
MRIGCGFEVAGATCALCGLFSPSIDGNSAFIVGSAGRLDRTHHGMSVTCTLSGDRRMISGD